MSRGRVPIFSRIRSTSLWSPVRSTLTEPDWITAHPKIGMSEISFLTTKRTGIPFRAASSASGSQLLSWFGTTT
jgi:hypothetical protein